MTSLPSEIGNGACPKPAAAHVEEPSPKQGGTSRMGCLPCIRGLIAWLCPVASDEDPLLPYVSLPWRRSLQTLHRFVLVYLELVVISTVVICPAWTFSAFQDNYFVAPQEICSRSLDTDVCYQLTEKAQIDGWKVSPIQGHAHRYGERYQSLIYAHIGLGSVLIVAVVGGFVLGLLRCAFPQDSEMHQVRRSAGAIVHYYLFMWAWVGNTAVVIVMAYTRYLTLGSEPSNWRFSFSQGFFVLFYFVVIVQLIALIQLFSGHLQEYTVFELRLRRMAIYAGQTMFLLLYAMLFVMIWEPRVQKSIGFTDTDLHMVAIVAVFGFEPMVGVTVVLGTSSMYNQRVISTCTTYFVTVLTWGLNVTYKYGPYATIPFVIALSASYVVALIHINFTVTTALLLKADKSFRWTCRTLVKNWFCGLCILLSKPPPAPEQANPGDSDLEHQR